MRFAISSALICVRVSTACAFPSGESGAEPCVIDISKVNVKLKTMADSIPKKRLADPSEIFAAAIFLLSDKSTYMQGASITADGGDTIC